MRLKKKALKNIRKKYVGPVLAIVLVVVSAIVFMASSRAATPGFWLEPESGNFENSAGQKVVDQTASSGAAVRFELSNSSGEVMTVGNLVGWKQVLAEDFNANATMATFDSTYANSWCGYQDGTGNKYYKIISATNGMMRINLDGTKGAAGSFGPPATCWGGIYGKYTMRFRVTGATGYGAANMVWPSSDIWGEGEVDYPEGNFNGTMHIFQHPINCTKCSANIALLDTGKRWTEWHTASTEWTAEGARYYLDGALIKTVTTNVPFNKHRWTLQMAPTSPQTSSGSFDIDWVVAYTQM